jgi:hypothetical protein
VLFRSASDIITRSDLAIAALLNEREDDARLYLAYTGAGRWEKSPFATVASMSLPPCGGLTDIKPDDMAVIEFSIGEDGAVMAAAPIFSTRMGEPAIEFAKAVSSWSWRPNDMKDIPQLFRLLTRVEVRCTLTETKPDLLAPLKRRTEMWMQSKGLSPYEANGAIGPALSAAISELAKRGTSGDLAKLPVLLAIGNLMGSPERERLGALNLATQILERENAPTDVTYYPRLAAFSATVNSTFSANEANRRQLRELLLRKEVIDDATVSAIIRLLVAAPAYRSGTPADAEALLKQVVGDRRLADTDPLKIGALVRLSSVQASAGKLEAARNSFQATGLTDQQCAIADAKPAIRRLGVSSSDYPVEALRWGFEGWVQTQYDIAADGSTTNRRAVVAYPPFVFRNAATKIVGNMRYTQSYRPNGATGCVANQEAINFISG